MFNIEEGSLTLTICEYLRTAKHSSSGLLLFLGLSSTDHLNPERFSACSRRNLDSLLANHELISRLGRKRHVNISMHSIDASDIKLIGNLLLNILNRGGSLTCLNFLDRLSKRSRRRRGGDGLFNSSSLGFRASEDLLEYSVMAY